MVDCTVPYGSVPRTRLNRDDWTAAALVALAEGGVAAVAIEPLAARLGTTKGSAYWHFPTRDELLRATLDRWEHRHTGAVIALMDTETDPARRLSRLLASVVEPAHAPSIELALVASADIPAVADALARVAARRVAYLADQFGALGFAPDEADRRALLAYSAYLGYGQLTRTAPASTPQSLDERRAMLATSLRVLLGPEVASERLEP